MALDIDSGRVTATELAEFIRENKSLAIIAITPKFEYVTLITREYFDETFNEIMKSSPSRRYSIATESIAPYIKQTLEMSHPDELFNNTNFNADLVLLMIVKAFTKQPVSVEKAGLVHIGLMVNPDSSIPWDQRGMLSPAQEKQLKTPIWTKSQLN
jgi:hypothetical protein